MYPEIEPQHVKLSKQGRFVIPQEIRDALNYHEGECLIIHVVLGELRIIKKGDAVDRAYVAPVGDGLTLAERVRIDRTGGIE